MLPPRGGILGSAATNISSFSWSNLQVAHTCIPHTLTGGFGSGHAQPTLRRQLQAMEARRTRELQQELWSPQSHCQHRVHVWRSSLSSRKPHSRDSQFGHRPAAAVFRHSPPLSVQYSITGTCILTAYHRCRQTYSVASEACVSCTSTYESSTRPKGCARPTACESFTSA